MASFVQVVDYLLICCLSPDKCESKPTKHDRRAVLFAVAELLVTSLRLSYDLRSNLCRYFTSVLKLLVSIITIHYYARRRERGSYICVKTQVKFTQIRA